MTGHEVALTSILDSLQGAIPAELATCDPDGVPNAVQVSIIQYVDSDRVAMPRRFHCKAAANLAASPLSQAIVTDPNTFDEYVLDLEYLHTETQGRLVESAETAYQALAAHAGLGGSGRLCGVDIHRVSRCVTLRGDGHLATTATAAATTGVAAREATPAGGGERLGRLDEFAVRMADADEHGSATRTALNALDDLFAIRHSILFAGDESRLHPIATHGYATEDPANVDHIPAILRIASERRRVVTVPNVPHGMILVSVAEAARRPSLDAARAIRLRGPEPVLSLAAVPLVHGRRTVGVLYAESDTVGRFGPNEERLLRILGTQIAATLVALDQPREQEPARADTGGGPLVVTYYQSDDSVFFGDDYVIKGVPGRILWKLLREHVADGRVFFTNRELRLDERLELPPGNDNLDSRLVSLRRRLARGHWGVELVRVARGRLLLRVNGAVTLSEVPTGGMMRREPSWPAGVAAGGLQG